MIKWTKSKEGYVESKCGRFAITPLWCGRVQPVFFKLLDKETKMETRSCFTQREAKQTAQRWADKG